MSLNEDIAPHLHELRTRMQASKRTDPGNQNVSGWGQFLDAEGHKEQIGPYGTCAAILLNRILQPETAEDDNVISQIERFWNDPGESRKLKSQNIRVGFLVLALAGTNDQRLQIVSQEAITTLVQRQRQDGSWGDWADGEANPPPRQETTAWITLALHRAGAAQEAVSKAQGYLKSFVSSVGDHSALSDFATAVLLKTLAPGQVPRKLLSRARVALNTFERGDFERISFFDYLENPGGNEQPSIRRDYLCYPMVLPFALTVSGVTQHSGWIGMVASSTSRVKLAQCLQDMVGDGTYFQLPGAAFASTVDQAAVALAFENLRESEKFFDARIAAVRPFISWMKRNIFFRMIVPIALAVVALTAIQDPKLLIKAVPSWSWIDEKAISSFLANNEGSIRLVAGIFLFFANSIPGRLWVFIKERWWH